MTEIEEKAREKMDLLQLITYLGEYFKAENALFEELVLAIAKVAPERAIDAHKLNMRLHDEQGKVLSNIKSIDNDMKV
jgi:hypothetical protein